MSVWISSEARAKELRLTKGFLRTHLSGFDLLLLWEKTLAETQVNL